MTSRRAAAAVAEDVLKTYGAEGWKTAWGNDFPERALAALRAALASNLGAG